jgi:hypothetical protein
MSNNKYNDYYRHERNKIQENACMISIFTNLKLPEDGQMKGSQPFAQMPRVHV